ncbi:beta-galactosidase/beta-glucuronidase [Pedobacter sp. CAN_A7]|uniref:glycoside hydrolase family 2 protein n=1 Tax=Pedobacter sp. CAN_A7 TaxID=2787722 RepID=UPI0018CA6155
MKQILTGFLLIVSLNLYAQDKSWAPVGDKIMTEWAEEVDPAKPLPEYPRPQMVRDKWLNLNGLWNYSLETVDSETKPKQYAGKILVPFAVESALSGVGKTVGKDSVIWYNRNFSLPANFKNNNVLMHFGAVDWRTEVYVNGKLAGSHEGGYDPFYFDITALLKPGKNQEVSIRVWDPTNDGPQPNGKQVKKPEGIWYTPVSGIWQTVWVEAVPKSFIASTKHTPDIDQEIVKVTADLKNTLAGDMVRVTVFDGTRKVVEQQETAGKVLTLKIADPKLWSPDQPFLYDLKITLIRKGKTVDEVKSYVAMRKISMQKDAAGIQRMMLNNKFLFHYGPLDQGWWPDGLYTAPTDEALKFDIVKTKEMGFNMIRKHIKVEPARWYYHCDQLGMLVWQDMPSGNIGNGWEQRPGVLEKGTDQKRTPESEGYFKKEWNAIMDALHNFQSIVVWVPFNEAWGQFKTEEITEWTMAKDPSRLVNSASGGNYYATGHMVDLHNYPSPAMPRPDLFGQKYVLVLGEFGGLGLPITGHTWQQKDNWGYQTFKNPEDMFKRYNEFTVRLEEFINLGLSAAVYTQTTDVEGEINGFMTYDRKVMKMPVNQLKVVNDRLYTVPVKFN